MSLVPGEPSEPTLVARTMRPETNPALVYLRRLGTGSRRTMRQALDAMAALMTDGRLDAAAFRWELLRYQHTQAVRARLLDSLAVATVNKHLSARGEQRNGIHR